MPGLLLRQVRIWKIHYLMELMILTESQSFLSFTGHSLFEPISGYAKSITFGNANSQCVSSALPLRFMQGEYGEAGRGINTKKRIFVGTIFCVTIGQVLNNPSELHKELSPCTCAGGVRQSREGVNHLIRFYSDF